MSIEEATQNVLHQ